MGPTEWVPPNMKPLQPMFNSLGKDTDQQPNGEDIHNRLYELIGKNPSDTGPKPSSINKYNSIYPPQRSIEKYKKQLPPTLQELKIDLKPSVQDQSKESASSMELENEKRELLFKFTLLKKKYKNPTVTIPEFTVKSDITKMKHTYETTIKHLTLDSSVDKYKKYLIAGFMGVEYILGKFLKLDMSGFTQQQVLSMDSYETLLLELGEKSYIPTSSQMSVEMRLMMMILINAAFFIGGKLIMKKTGSDIVNMMSGFKNNTKNKPTQSKRKMNGPKMDIDDIKVI